MKWCEGQFADLRIYNRVLTPIEIANHYLFTRLAFMSWYERLWLWIGMTWLVLTGKRGWQ